MHLHPAHNRPKWLQSEIGHALGYHYQFLIQYAKSVMGTEGGDCNASPFTMKLNEINICLLFVVLVLLYLKSIEKIRRSTLGDKITHTQPKHQHHINFSFHFRPTLKSNTVGFRTLGNSTCQHPPVLLPFHSFPLLPSVSIFPSFGMRNLFVVLPTTMSRMSANTLFALLVFSIICTATNGQLGESRLSERPYLVLQNQNLGKVACPCTQPTNVSIHGLI